MPRFIRAALFAVACALSTAVVAQVPQYGANVSQEQARKAVVAALAEAAKLNIPMAIAVVDTSGQLVAFERQDNTQYGSIAVAQDKAKTSALFRRPTKAFQDVLAGGGSGLRILTLNGVVAIEGGLPLVVDGKIIGGIGVSGGTAEQDGVVAKGATDALAAK